MEPRRSNAETATDLLDNPEAYRALASELKFHVEGHEPQGAEAGVQTTLGLIYRRYLDDAFSHYKGVRVEFMSEKERHEDRRSRYYRVVADESVEDPAFPPGTFIEVRVGIITYFELPNGD